MRQRDPNNFFFQFCYNMFSVHWDELGAHFYTNWECIYHFSGFFTWNFNIFFTVKPKKPET